MALSTPEVWTVTPQSTWTTQIRADIDAALGLSVDYVATIDGAWTFEAGQLAFEVEQHVAEALSGSLLATASRPVVVARALDRGLTPRTATKSTIEVELATGAGGVLPVGTALRVQTGTVYFTDYANGGITITTTATWTVIENSATGSFVVPTDLVIIECDLPGQVYINAAATWAPVTPITGIGTLTADAMRTTGRDAERLPALRLRVANARAVPGGSPAGLLAALRNIPWVVGVGLTQAAGQITVTVAPTPPTSTEAVVLAQAIYDNKAAGVLTLGASSAAVLQADGTAGTINYAVGATQNVTVAFTVTPDPAVSQADADQLARDAIFDVFDQLGPGDILRYLHAFAALDQPSILSATLTLNGGTSDVTPATAADVLIPVFS